MNRVLLALTLILLLHPLQASDDFSNKDRTVIYTHSLDIIKEYGRLINEMGEYAVSDLEAARSLSESLLELFVNRQVLVYNDLDPTYNLSPFYEVETYVSNLLLWYPDGMFVRLDMENARAGDIVQHDDEIYSLDILVPKIISGNYLNRSQNNNTEELLFRIAFNKRTAGFGNYKIVGVRNTDATLNPDFNRNLEEVNAEQMNENDLYKIEEGIRAVLNDYENYIALLGSNEEVEEDKAFYREGFTELFDNESVKVYNDLHPEPENSLVSIDDYLILLTRDYPNGINNVSILTDSVAISQPIKTEEGYYYSKIEADKFFSGSHQGHTAFREMFPLSIKVRYEAAGNTFSNFKIQSIDIEASEYFTGSSETEDFELPAFEIQTISRNGLSVGFEAGYGFSAIENQNILAMNMGDNEHEWTHTMRYGNKAGIHVYYYLNDMIGIKSGLEYLSYDYSYSLNGTFTADQLTTSPEDPNQYEYYKVVMSDFDSLLSVRSLSIPLIVSLNSGRPGKYGMFFEGGFSVGYNISSTVNTSGSYAVTGDFSHNSQLESIKDYIVQQDFMGFYTEDKINRAGNLSVGNINLSGYVSFGVSIPLGYFSNINIGPEVYYGLNDLDRGKDFLDIFGNSMPAKSTLLKKYSVKISYILKL